MTRNVSHRINDPALKNLEEATWVLYHLCWEDFGHLLKQANAGVKFPKWSQWYITAADPLRLSLVTYQDLSVSSYQSKLIGTTSVTWTLRSS
jgi:hypothetical protein